MSKHSPGPWLVDDDTGVIFSGTGSGAVAMAPYPQNRAANARLIAAAPDMLAALKAASRIRNGWPEVFDLIDAAIAKATGSHAGG